MSNKATWEQFVQANEINTLKLKDIATRHGTPCYVYAHEIISEACKDVVNATKKLDVRLSYAVKANGNLSILKIIATHGLGFDIASLVELRRAIQTGCNPQQIVFTGPGKNANELREFIKLGGGEIICDSVQEFEHIVEIANSSKTKNKITIGVRVNPDIQAGGHPNISTGTKDTKFGMSDNEAIKILTQVAKHGKLVVGSLNSHIGSQIDSVKPYQDAIEYLIKIQAKLARKKIEIQRLDLGGGFGIGDSTKRPTDVFSKLCKWLEKNYQTQPIGFQPGRLIVGRSAVLLTKVEYVKNNFIIVDAAMTELMRPALYGAKHGIAKLGSRPATRGNKKVVGPVCETTDWLVKDCNLNVQSGDILAIFDAGAYAAAMMSGYNGRLRPCELLIKDKKVRTIRKRDTVDDVLVFEL